MVTVVQWLARLTVDQKVEGSNPSSHPNNRRERAGFFIPRVRFGYRAGRVAARLTPAAQAAVGALPRPRERARAPTAAQSAPEAVARPCAAPESTGSARRARRRPARWGGGS